MNAKEISDATLPAVTPADNDLMLIYDTLEGTTGKVTLDILKAFFYHPVIVNYTLNIGEFLEGGVFRIGNVVMINMSITFTTISNWTLVLENLPLTNYVVNFSFTIAKTGAGLFPACGFVTTDGRLYTRLLSEISSGTAFISVSYLCI